MAPTPPGTPAARSASPRMRNLSCAVKVRRRGRPKSSGDAAAGAETIFGLRPSSLSAPAAAGVLLSLIRGITTGCLSYALKGKLPAGLCLIIIGTEGNLHRCYFIFRTIRCPIRIVRGDDIGLGQRMMERGVDNAWRHAFGDLRMQRGFT